MNQTTQKLIKAFAICLAIFIIVSIINIVVYFASSIFSVNNDVSINENYSSEIKNIRIDMVTSNLVIKKGDTLNVTADNVSKRFKVNEESNTLTIKEKSVNVFRNKSISKVIITIPSNLKDLSIDVDAGKLEISDINTSRFNLDQGAGKVTITNLISNKTDIDGGAGELNITSSVLEDLDLDMGAGKFYFSGSLHGNNKIEQGIGELILDLNGNDYTIKASKGLGSITINGESYSKDATVGEGINDIKIDGGVGI